MTNQTSIDFKSVSNGATIPITIAITVVLGLFLQFFALPRMDPREPPLLKPTIPLIGHIIGMFRYQADYHLILRRKTHQPIATLPMLTGKMYAVWDPVLLASGLRNKHLSTSPSIKTITQPLMHVSNDFHEYLNGPDGDALIDRIMLHAIPSAFKPSAVQKMNEAALIHIAADLSALAAATGNDDVEIPNVWMWIRSLITSVTAKAVYGKEDPFSKDPGMEQALWDLESDMLKLTLDVFPSVIAPAGNRGRALLTKMLTPFYSAKHDTDPSASDFVRNRAAEQRSKGVSDEDLAKVEMLLPFAALTNTVPTLFWFWSFIVSRPELAAQLRDEIETNLIAKRHGNVVTLRAGSAAVEERCPLLWSCYRETLRMTIHQVSTRTVMQDTTISDGRGNSYLLKEGMAIQMSIGVGHAMQEYWGSDVAEFKADRFLNLPDAKTDDGGPGSARAIKAAYQPFGGGMHLCPGRNFAVAEMMSVVTTMLLGFDVSPLGRSDWKLPVKSNGSLIDAVTKPAGNGKGFGIRVRRRPGWEGVSWNYEL
ncbi:cytochrome P450 [Apodospora peruviana]|uniref:Cytochrome P450 n=1 Tax=Apodospora peruviana TaxID=516989 RepID=A0AAE0M8Q8_9PEZI|nr:cytochrome P450 [Apodospora peruviana]